MCKFKIGVNNIVLFYMFFIIYNIIKKIVCIAYYDIEVINCFTNKPNNIINIAKYTYVHFLLINKLIVRCYV